MTWPIEHFHYIPAPSRFIETIPGAMKAMTQCVVIKQSEEGVILFTPKQVFMLTIGFYWMKGSY